MILLYRYGPGQMDEIIIFVIAIVATFWFMLGVVAVAFLVKTIFSSRRKKG